MFHAGRPAHDYRGMLTLSQFRNHCRQHELGEVHKAGGPHEQTGQSGICASSIAAAGATLTASGCSGVASGWLLLRNPMCFLSLGRLAVAFLPHMHLFCYTFFRILNPIPRRAELRIRVFGSSADPAIDKPVRYDAPTHAAHLVAMNRATIVGSRSIKLLPLPVSMSREFISAAGYDAAANTGAVKSFSEVWKIRQSGPRRLSVWQMISQSRRVTG